MAMDVPEVLERVAKPNVEGKVEGMVAFDWNWSDDKILAVVKGLPPLDVILASDVIFNKEQLLRVPKALRLLVQEQEQRTVVFLAYKDRNETLSAELYSTFVACGFEGEQVSLNAARLAVAQRQRVRSGFQDEGYRRVYNI